MTLSKEIEKALFEAAVVIETPEVRRAFLDQACQGDLEQRTRLGNLLEAQVAADEFFLESEGARTVVAAEACKDLTPLPIGEDMAGQLEEEDGPGTWIGRYKVQERIGEGGCGVVYLAEQQEPVRRLVALKVIRLGMDTESVIARFEMERQSLAVMDHPNIARVLDAGATDTGRPYFVMEWVRGVKITDYCNENRLDIRQRLDLFIEVCHAIQHAHQKGVIHRDIKPSNILVTLHDGKPSPKVIDFGIAKATERKADDEATLTAYEQFVGTPAYMSPEQADRKGVDVDTRSDVYGLGILLYELLTGRTPFDPKELASAGVLETRRILMEREPPPPSALLASLSRPALAEIASRCQCEPAKLISSVKGDLDWVVMKAIEKDRQRRYETVNGFALDLRRFIGNEPVLARPPSRMYLAGKFVRRNRLAVIAITGIAASLVLGLGLAYGSYLRERGARQEQARLRLFAESARANETKLLANAKARENIAQVAVLMSEGKSEEADAKLRETPLSTIEPSLEAADVLRSLGSWNAMRGRWQQASECFMLLTQATLLSSPDQIGEKYDLLVIGLSLAECHNMADFERYRHWALSRFGDTTQALAAEHMLHGTLVLPADQDFLDKLMPLKDLIERTTFGRKRPKPGYESVMAGWQAWSVAFLEYRRGEYDQSLEWGQRAMGFRIPCTGLSALIHPILAMSYYKKGNMDGAREELEMARQLIRFAYAPELPPSFEPCGKDQGFWWDWALARILCQEAQDLINGPSHSS